MPDDESKSESRIPPLLRPADPPPVEVVNEDGRAPILFICDHASNRIPAALDSLGLDPAALALHIAWDIGAAGVARRLSTRFDAPLVLTGYSRLVIDCNRRTDDPTSIALVSEDTVIEGNRNLTSVELEQRAEAVYRPYHRVIERLIGGFRDRGDIPALISMHSFTPVFKGIARPWHIGILWNQDPRLPVPLLETLGAVPDVVVGDNVPYSGQNEYGYSVKTHGEGNDLPNVLIELRDDLLRTPAGIKRWADILGDALEQLLSDPAVHRVQLS